MAHLPQKMIITALVLVGLFVLAAIGKATTEVCSAAVAIATAFIASNIYLTKTMTGNTPQE